jgi:hypothetical protein
MNFAGHFAGHHARPASESYPSRFLSAYGPKEIQALLEQIAQLRAERDELRRQLDPGATTISRPRAYNPDESPPSTWRAAHSPP